MVCETSVPVIKYVYIRSTVKPTFIEFKFKKF